MKRIITVAIVGVLTLGLSALVYAETSTNTKSEKPKVSQSEKGGRGGFKLNLSKFVEDGTISQEQADKITALLDQKKAERQAEREKVKNMTDEEKKAYFQANKDCVKKTDVLSDLVNSNIITQEQADTLSKVLFKGNDGKHRGKVDSSKDANTTTTTTS